MLLSLQKNCSQLHVHVLCLDKETQNILSTINLSFVTLISLAEIEDEKSEVGTIIQEIQSGYMLGERLLRPALVGVAKKKDPKSHEKKEK